MPIVVYPDAGENLGDRLSDARRAKLDALGGLEVHYGRPESHDAKLRAGRWNQSTMGMELRGRTIGGVGFGGIGRRFAEIAKAIGMRVVAWTRTRNPERARVADVEFVGLERLLAEC